MFKLSEQKSVRYCIEVRRKPSQPVSADMDFCTSDPAVALERYHHLQQQYPQNTINLSAIRTTVQEVGLSPRELESIASHA